MEEKLKITFKVIVSTKYGSLVDKFNIQAETKQEAQYLVMQQLKAEGIYDDVEYKIT